MTTLVTDGNAQDVETDSPMGGILLITFGMSIFSLQDVIIRLLSNDLSVVQVMFIRGLVALGPIALIAYYMGGFRSLKTKVPLLHAARGLMMIFSYTTYYMAMAEMPMADVTAYFFITPLLLTMCSVFFFKEQVGISRWTAVAIGFVGVLIMMRPGSEGFSLYAFLPLSGSLSYSLAMTLTRKMGRTQSGACMAFYAMLAFLGFSGIAGLLFGDGSFANESVPALGFLLRAWIMPDVKSLWMISGCGIIAAVGFFCISQCYKIAPASIAAPFEYVALPLSVLWGYVFWGEIPAITTFIGIGLIVSSGIYVLKRESIKGQKITTGRGRRIRL